MRRRLDGEIGAAMANVERALSQLAAPGAVLARTKNGDTYGVFPRGDRRRRPMARMASSQVAALHSSGAIKPVGHDAFAISQAGRSSAKRIEAAPGEAFVAQHLEIEHRSVVDEAGHTRTVRAIAQDALLRRLSGLSNGAGAAWLSTDELAAARMLRADWELSQRGLTRGSDLTAAPQSGSARGPGNAQERRLAIRCDARRRMADALDKLAPPLRRIVERVCLSEQGLEAIERDEGWPARSAKLALKLGLAQLASAYAAKK